jgi:1-acyl-sn-glycerol-3-phosphate acyltransferase
MARFESVEFRDQGFGFDRFGAEREIALLFFVLLRWFHRSYFRVETRGAEHVPAEGRCLVVGNHSGTVPFDGGMLFADLVLNAPRPRLMRAVADTFIGHYPFVGLLLNRMGQVVGHRRNFEDLLADEQIVAVFPEGTRGVGKPFSRRYRLVRFNVGFIEMALRCRTPIVPCSFVGAEEQQPMLYDVEFLARALRLPYFPITPTFPLLGPLGILPLPVKYHMAYGEPFRFHEEYPPEAAEDADVVRMLADKVQISVQEMIDIELERRKGVFF